MAARRVQALLMGGQACVFYGAAEFSRDTDLLILADMPNLERLEAAFRDLQAECIAVPPLSADYLYRGHAVHFRCHHPEAQGMRVDLMSKLRGVAEFKTLWNRRTTITDMDGTSFDLISLPDLVQAKKTQRSKDWPMLQRLLEAHYLSHRASATEEQQLFWLLELRTAPLLIEAAKRSPELKAHLLPQRPLLALAEPASQGELEKALDSEQNAEREKDRIYWQPLKIELEELRHEFASRKR